MNIGDIWFALRGEGSQLQVDAAKAAEAAGFKGGQSFSKSFGTIAKSAIGSAIGAGLGIALSGANQLDAATRKLQADTGMTAEEATKAEHALAGMYRNNLQGFDAIGEAMAKVHNDLGLSGDAADKATAKFLKFSTATGQDAAGSVTALDDILDAWNLTAADSGSVMDKLVASHQKYGGSIEENERALATLAPQLQALNVDMDGAVGLLNLFESSGLDATKATFALNTAVKNLKPGENLDDLIARLSAIEDPTLRAQEAIKVFGARGGVALANTLRPGITSLADFSITADGAAGATEKAAEAVESGFGAQFQLLLKNAGGALADFGTNFGPLVMVAAMLGPKMTTALAASFGALTSVLGPKLLGSLTGAVKGIIPGVTVQGGLLGTALGTGLAAAAVIAVGFAFLSIKAEIDRQAEELTARTTDYVKTATLDALEAARKATAQQLLEANKPFFLGGALMPFPGTAGIDVFGTIGKIGQQLDILDAEISRRTRQIGSDAVNAFTEGTDLVVPGAVGRIAWFVNQTVAAFVNGTPGLERSGHAAGVAAGTSLADGMAKSVPAVRESAVSLLAAAAATIRDQRSTIDAAIDAVTEDLKRKQLGATAELAKLLTARFSAALSEALRSPDALTRADAEYAAQLLDDQIAALKPRPGIMSERSKELLDEAQRSADPNIRNAARHFADVFNEEGQRALADATAKAALARAGTELVTDGLAPGIESADSFSAIDHAIEALLDRALTKWRDMVGLILPGFTLAPQPAGGTGGGGLKHLAGGGSLGIGEPAVVGESGPEFFVPHTAGEIVPRVSRVGQVDFLAHGHDIYLDNDKVGEAVAPAVSGQLARLVRR